MVFLPKELVSPHVPMNRQNEPAHCVHANRPLSTLLCDAVFSCSADTGERSANKLLTSRVLGTFSASESPFTCIAAIMKDSNCA